MAEVLSSDWTGLSKNLIASFYPVTRVKGDDGKYRWQRDSDQPEVRAPLTDGTIDSTFLWHSSFEGMGADQKWSALSALLQTGALQEAAAALSAITGKSWVANKIEEGVEYLRGRTSVTKLNSTQVFTGLPPTKLSFTAHFRAYADAKREVASPINQLLQWAYPQELAEVGPLLGAARGEVVGLYPSKVPQIIAMSYAGSLYYPMVIESMPVPLTPPRNKDGQMLHAQVSMTIASLSALDANDWKGGWLQR